MTDTTNTAAPAAQSSPAEQKASFMSNAEWRAAAAKPNSAEWAQLSSLNEQIAAAMDAEAGAGEAAAEDEKRPAALSATDDDGNVHTFDVPTTPAGYQFQTQQAQLAGLEVDHAAEAEMRAGFHAAGVDGAMASLLYTAAVTAAKQPLDAVKMAGRAHETARALEQTWGGSFEANLEIAADEAYRIFEALPKSITGGADFETYVQAAGLANNRVLIENLYLRGKARAAKG